MISTMEDSGMSAQLHKRAGIQPEAQEQAHSRAGTRELRRWRPAGLTGTVRAKTGESVVFYTLSADVRGQFRAIAYRGRSEKHEWHYRFLCRADMERHITAFVDGLRLAAAAKAKRIADRKAPHTLKVGDVLNSSWGYEQTNIDYYQVTRVTSHGVYLRSIAQRREDTGYLSGDCVPLADHFTGEEFFRRASSSNSVRIASYAYATPTKSAVVGGVRIFTPGHWTAYA